MKKVRVPKYVGVYTYQSLDNPKHRCLWINYKLEGKLKWEKVGWNYEGATPSNASNLRGQRIWAARHGEPVTKTRGQGITLDQAYESWVRYAVAQGIELTATQSRYKAQLKDWAGGVSLSLITPRMVHEQVRAWSVIMSPGSMYQVLSTLKKIIRLAQLEGYAGPDPLKGVPVKAPPSRRFRFFTYKEATLLCAALETHPETLLAVRMGLLMGFRKMELEQIRGRDINFNTNTITVIGKGGRERSVPMPERIRRLLVSFNLGPNELLIQDPRKVELRYRQIVKDLGFNDSLDQGNRGEWVVFHTLRHTFASWLAKEGRNLKEIMTLMGHTDPKVTMIYIDLFPNATQAAVNSIADAWVRS